MLQAKNGSIHLGGVPMDYIAFGSGERHLIMLPGLGDGLMTVRGKAQVFALMYGKYARHFRVWMFSRKRQLPVGFTTADMAEDVYKAMVLLGIPKAGVIGISQGGMIAQHLAANHPDKVERLVLVVTTPKCDAILDGNVRRWIDMAERDDYAAIMEDNLRQMYTEGYVQKNRWLLPITTRVGKPKSFDRFIVQAHACLTHDAEAAVPNIIAPTLILGGAQDHTIDPKGSHALQDAIPNSRIHIWENYGHAVYDEARDFDEVVLAFLK